MGEHRRNGTMDLAGVRGEPRKTNRTAATLTARGSMGSAERDSPATGPAVTLIGCR
jgi:hypothetical protein